MERQPVRLYALGQAGLLLLKTSGMDEELQRACEAVVLHRLADVGSMDPRVEAQVDVLHLQPEELVAAADCRLMCRDGCWHRPNKVARRLRSLQRALGKACMTEHSVSWFSCRG